MNTSYLSTWAWRRPSNTGVQAISVPGLGSDQPSSNTSYLRKWKLGLAAPNNPKILEYKLSQYLGLAPTQQSWNTSYLTIWAGQRPAILEYKLYKLLGLTMPSNPGIQAISIPGLSSDPAILEYKLSRHLGWQHKQSRNTSYLDTWAWMRLAILEYKLCRCLGLAKTVHPGIQTIKGPGLGNTSNPGIQTIWARAGTQQSWNASYLGTWAWQRPAILDYKLSKYLGLAATSISWNTSYLAAWACAATSNPGIQSIKGPGLGTTSNPGIQAI